jgi:hypothetical protein
MLLDCSGVGYVDEPVEAPAQLNSERLEQVVAVVPGDSVENSINDLNHPNTSSRCHVPKAIDNAQYVGLNNFDDLQKRCYRS